eukprot:SM000152S01545  [mRNA]  locus=s152:117674:123033:+ [translate_table: standard]
MAAQGQSTSSPLLPPPSDAEYYRTLPPSQLLVERGAGIVVINPGSALLRIGRASQAQPHQVAHCVAHLRQEASGDITTGPAATDAELRRPGAVGFFPVNAAMHATRQSSSLPFSLSSQDGAIVAPGAAGESQRELLLARMEAGLRSTAESPKVELGRSWTIHESEDSSFAWTCVHEPTTAEEDLKPPGWSWGSRTRLGRLRPTIFGNDATRIPAACPYDLRRPMWRGHLNTSPSYSLQQTTPGLCSRVRLMVSQASCPAQVLDDLAAIWGWALSSLCSLSPSSWQQLSAVLVVPDTLYAQEIGELVSVVLRYLQFHAIVVHQEALAATFGYGISTACVINLGAQTSSVVCVEEKSGVWLYRGCKPAADCQDLALLEELKESHCRFEEGEQQQVVDFKVRSQGQEVQCYSVTLVNVNMPPLGLFFPTLLAPEECFPWARSWCHLQHEDTLEEFWASETGRRADVLAAGDLEKRGQLHELGNWDMRSHKNARGNSDVSLGPEGILGLAASIVSSILLAGSPDLQSKLFMTMQLVGGTSNMRGLPDFLEEQVLNAIPQQVSISTVEVLPFKGDPGNICWKGGTLLGVLDSAAEAWLQQKDWLNGGLRVGAERKYREATVLQSQAFWYLQLGLE